MIEFYTETEIVKNEFLFVSYKHEDKNIVQNTVEYLIKQGVMLWFDKDLVCGDAWDERVKRLINHQNCLGVIFFNSKDAFASDAVEKERCLVDEKLKTLEPQKKFEIFPVSLGQKKTIEILKEMFDTLSYSDVSQQAEKLSNKTQTVLRLFRDNKIFIYADPEAENDFRQDLLEAIKAKLPQVMATAKFKLDQLKELNAVKNVGNLMCVDFGFEKKRVAPHISGSRLKQGNRVITYNDEHFMIYEQTAYTVQPLEWLCIYYKDDEVVMITKDVIGRQKGGDSLDQWLKEVFLSSSFTEEQQKIILELRLLNEDDFNQAEDKTFLTLSNVSQSENCKWWMGVRTNGLLQKAVKENGGIYHNGYNSKNSELGVRPVINVKVDSLRTFLQNNE